LLTPKSFTFFRHVVSAPSVNLKSRGPPLKCRDLGHLTPPIRLPPPPHSVLNQLLPWRLCSSATARFSHLFFLRFAFDLLLLLAFLGAWARAKAEKFPFLPSPPLDLFGSYSVPPIHASGLPSTRFFFVGLRDPVSFDDSVSCQIKRLVGLPHAPQSRF